MACSLREKGREAGRERGDVGVGFGGGVDHQDTTWQDSRSLNNKNKPDNDNNFVL